jgi:hypothetical protein
VRWCFLVPAAAFVYLAVLAVLGRARRAEDAPV